MLVTKKKPLRLRGCEGLGTGSKKASREVLYPLFDEVF